MTAILDLSEKVMGKVHTTLTIVNRADQDPLLGVIPLEMLGLEPDLKNQALRVLPTESVDTYLTIL